MPWKKGQSGNPKGRPPGNAVLKEMAQTHGEAAIARLVYWLASPDPTASINAAKALLDRGYGKPHQAVEVSGADGGPIKVSAAIDRPPPAKDYAEWLTRHKAQ